MLVSRALLSLFFFFNDTATTEIYTLSLHDALPISLRSPRAGRRGGRRRKPVRGHGRRVRCVFPKTVSLARAERSEEHTSELQSLAYLVCRLLLEKKKTITSSAEGGSAVPKVPLAPS